MRLNKGFTLIEILAVIVVLAIILAISMPVITGVFGNATKNAFESDAKLVIRGIEYQKLEDEAFDVTTINETNVESILKISDENYQSIVVSEVNGKASIVIVGKNKWDGLVAYGTFKTMSVDNIEDYSPDETPPVITMIGDSPIAILEGSTYSDAGATALDDVDGNITENITVTNHVNTNETGTYTVIYNVMDSAGNMAIPVARVVNVVNNIPVINIVGDSPYVIQVGSVYNDPGATALDDVDGDISANIITTSNVNPNIKGTYSVTYDVVDSEGNAAPTVTRIVHVIDLVNNYSYTGDAQTFVAPINGTYQIELWGGGTQINDPYDEQDETIPGKGAYTKGKIELEEGDTLYIYVGSEGDNRPTMENYDASAIYNGVFNGGGACGGAGATDIRLVAGTWDNLNSLKSRIMVAGGGGRIGGFGDTLDYYLETYHGVTPATGGNGGLTGTAGATYSEHDPHGYDYWYGGSGGTQTSSGIGASYRIIGIYDGEVWRDDSYKEGRDGTFGAGGNGCSIANFNDTYVCHGGGGGGGYYGGGSGICQAGSSGPYFASGGGGGSSFISGHTGCDAIDTDGNHTGTPNHYSGLIFTDTEIQSGIRDGNGYATITYIP